jgi:hypothetical protein
MIKIKTNEITGILKGLSTLLEQRMPVKLAYWFNKLSQKLISEQRSYEELRIKLCKDYCDKDVDNNPIIIDDRYSGLTDNQEFTEKLAELFNLEIEIDFEPIKIESLESADIKLTGAEMMALDKIIGD